MSGGTLQDKVRYQWVHACRKHDLALPGETAEQYADGKINQLDNAGFLELLSEALEERLKKK